MTIHLSIKVYNYNLLGLCILWLSLLFLSHASQNIMCSNEDKDALLEFKRGIQVDHCGLLSSWVHREVNGGCCQWRGVLCNNLTGHVIGIKLSATEANPRHHCLEGKVSASLLKLKHLKYLDLSFNKFKGQPIPKFIGSFANLKHLNISNCGFSGEIPREVGNLPHLTSLDLSGNNKITVKNLGWLSRLTSLSVINLSNIDLSKVRNWYQVIANLPFLKILKLEWCNLSPLIPSNTAYKNSSFSSLHFLSLAHNSFGDPSIFQWLFNLNNGISSHLVHLDLSDNSLPGSIPNGFRNMHLLSYLDLSSNSFEGHIPNFFANMHSLSHLDLSANLLDGSISSCFRNMESLLYIDVSGNALQGQIPEMISNLKNLIHLDLSWNNFQGLVPKSLGNLCNLQFLELSYNNLTGDLPVVIQNLNVCSHKSLRFLNLESNHFRGSVPDAIKTFSSLELLYLDTNELNGTVSQGIAELSMLESLRLSSNSLKGTISEIHFANLSRLRNLDLSNNSRLLVNISVDWIPPFQLDTIYMSSCKLGPSFPKWLQTQTQLSWIDISIAGISDSVPTSFWSSLSSQLEYLNMSHNNIHGTLPINLSISLGELPQIDLSSNSIGGAIPSFLGNVSLLSLNDNKFSDPIPFLCPKSNMVLSNLDISDNLISGKLPDCWMYFDKLSILHLENNNFFGELPASIGALKKLQALHLRNNSFSGELPMMSLQNCTSLVLLDVSYNSFDGYIPSSIGKHLKNLGILSLRSNKFSGVTPSSLCELDHLQILDLSLNHISGNIPSCLYNLKAMTTTADLLPNILYQYDFSVIMRYFDAAFVMWKRKEQTFRNSLGQVKFIHMSDNVLEGEIPEGISSLVGLISLDLSRNKLNGSITPKIGKLRSLELLDLSSNHISGKIPATLANLNFLGTLNLSYNNLSGKIPIGTQLQGFDTSAYMGNPKLCGAPLEKCHENGDDEPPSGMSSGDDHDSQQDVNDRDDILLGLYISVILGFIVGFWGVCGTLVIKRSWRHAFFKACDGIKDRAYMMIYGS